MTVRNVLVAFDFGEAADAVLAYGRAFARSFGATLHVMHVGENVFMRAVVGDPRSIQDSALRRVQERLTEEDRRLLNVRIVSEVSDDVTDAVVGYARTEQVDLIVTGTHGRTGLERSLIGSVAEHIVRNAPCPVLTVRQHERDFVPVRDPYGPIKLNTVLVATDFGEAAEAAVKSAHLLSARFGATLHAIHVVSDAHLEMLGDAIPTSTTLKRDVEEAAKKRLDESIARGGASAGPVHTTVLTAHSPTFAVLDYAKDHEVDLIVMGTHGRGMLGRMLMGSVAERVVRLAPCPVLTVKHA